MFLRPRCRAPCSCLTRPSQRPRFGISFPSQRRKRCCARRSSSTSSMATRWHARPEWARASTPSCKPASSPSAVCCRVKKPSLRSRRRSRKPTASAAKPWWPRTSRRWMLRWRTLKRWNCQVQLRRTSTLSLPSPAARRSWCAMCWVRLLRVTATRYRSARFRPAVHFRLRRRNGRSATSRSSSPYGTRICASSAANA